MHTVRLTKVGGDSLGVTLPRKVLRAMRWNQGDHLLLNISTDRIEITNFTRHPVMLDIVRREDGDSVGR